MGDIMRPVPFQELLQRIDGELTGNQSIFGIPVAECFHKYNGQKIAVFGEESATPVGPAAGPHTQLAQNIISSWLVGGRFIELKTVQKLDQLELDKPCIDPEDECYNTEWSTEFTLVKAFDEYLKAWFVLHLFEELLTPAPVGNRSFIFNMSVGYDLEGIKTAPMQAFIDNMLDASNHPSFKRYQTELRNWLNTTDIAARMGCPERTSQIASLPDQISPKLTRSVTLSTMHGCPPNEIEAICHYMLTEKKIDTFVKLNPTLLGFDRVRGILDGLGFDYIGLDENAFSHDLQMDAAIPMLQRLQAVGQKIGCGFGIKLSNTLGCINTGGACRVMRCICPGGLSIR